MPTYQDPLHGVSFSEAAAEAIAVAPITRVMFTTLELRHPSLPAPVRIVNDHADLTATLEAGAPADAGQAVEFLACAVRISRPEESDAAASPEIALEIDNVSGLLSDALRAARGSLVPWEITERIYASDDTSAPAVMPPLTLIVASVDVTGTTARLGASFGDPVNVSVPRLTFRRREYPGLSAR